MDASSLIHNQWKRMTWLLLVCREGWRSAVGRRPHIGLHVPSTSVRSTTRRRGARRHSKLDITIDRFGQEEDVTGASFTEPITYVSDRDVERSSPSHQIHVSRSLSKQSDTAQLSNLFSKFSQQPIDDRRPFNIGNLRVM